ncbi:MAG: hypothetical protein NTY67_06915 [Cyanobacteria bacterium]|nr:hypothetical protein [Cyanobacteriota bacterium]
MTKIFSMWIWSGMCTRAGAHATGRDLRVHLYAWINRLLEDRVIDALRAPYPMISGLDREKLVLLPLYSTDLVLLARSDCLLANERDLSQLDVELTTRMGSLDFVLIEAGSCSLKADSQMFSP